MKFKVKTEIEREIEADNEDEAINKYWEKMLEDQRLFEIDLNENTTVTRK